LEAIPMQNWKPKSLYNLVVNNHLKKA